VTDLQDQAARARIRTDLGKTLFVEAGAGSGKTSALVGRLTNLVLIAKVPLRYIAAVTFTEKAAAELRDRLRAELVRQLKGGQDEELLRAALEDLDVAAIGTLHSFAQRLLTRHPIEAGLPPLVEVSDEVSSQIAFEERWTTLRRELLDDPDVREPLLMAMASGVKLDHLRSLAKVFTGEWDRLQESVLDPAQNLKPLSVDVSAVVVGAQAALGFVGQCTDRGDKLLGHFGNLQMWLEELEAAADDGSRLQILLGAGDLKSSNGRKGNWPDIDLARAALQDVHQLALTTAQAVLDNVLRRLAARVAASVLEHAQERRRSGQLEFHDLLVLSRDLLRSPVHGASVRRSLHDTFQRLLLDEFQDTDPIQIEIATRIAAGQPGDAADWADVDVPDGRLFVVGDPKQSIYRFRRADISMYLRAQQALGGQVQLTTNFRSGPRVVAWVNEVFGRLIQEQPRQQPKYQPLTPHREDAPGGARVTELGRQPHPGKPSADTIRTAEAADVARAIRTALQEKWQVFDESTEQWRDVALDDIAVLVPARTSLPQLEAALSDAGIPYRAEASSLVYRTPEVRDLLMVARALDDPSDALALVASLRSPLFGCGDDDLWTWKQATGAFNLRAPIPDGLEEHPVGLAIAWLGRWHYRAKGLAPSELLQQIVADRRMMETPDDPRRARDVWRRLRFVVDHARAWTEAEGGALRDYLSWASRQGDEASRVAEAVLPETDAHSVRILTIHAAKGLEFPVVILSGLSAKPGGAQRGIDVLWGEGTCAFKFSKALQTEEFEAAKPIDEQMGYAERLRLLYVGATRARDHLVVSLHRKEPSGTASEDKSLTNAELLARESASLAHPADTLPELELPPVPESGQVIAGPPATWGDFAAQLAASRSAARQPAATSPSSLEGGDVRDDLELEIVAGLDKGPRNLELPPWNKGRYGTAVGRAVHAVLQVIDLATGGGLEAAVDAQCLAEGVTIHREEVARLCRNALQMDVVVRAAARPHWKETYVGSVDDDGQLVEGFVDLIYEEDDGTLVVVDYKADAVPAGAVAARAQHYAPQIAAYLDGVHRATAKVVSSGVLAFLHPQQTVSLSYATTSGT
jgi:ATP-dependent exoDNAse (exonuclease V) beta subunit